MRGIGIYNEDSITLKSNLDLLEENISRILLTNQGERVCNPTFGCRFKNFLFDMQNIMQEEALAEVASAIGKWEPRVTVQNISIVNIDANTLAIKIDLVENTTLETFTFNRLIRF